VTPGGGDSASGRRGDAAPRSPARGGHGSGGKRGTGTGDSGHGGGRAAAAARDSGSGRPDSDVSQDHPDQPVQGDGQPGQGDGQPEKPEQAEHADRTEQAEPAGQAERPRMPPVRLAPREELAAAARVAPLLRAAADLSRWADEAAARFAGDALAPADTLAAAAALELTPAEVDAAWQVVVATGLREEREEDAGNGAARLDQQDASEVLGAWDAALAAILDAEELDGLATALYTVGAPVRIDALFEAYAAAAGGSPPTGTSPIGTSPAGTSPTGTSPAASSPDTTPTLTRPDGHQPDEAAALSGALETLADLGVVELGTEENAGGLTVALSPLGVWGVHRRLRGQGWHVPVLGGAGRDGAVGLLMTLASCDAEDGEAEIGAWLAGRSGPQAARELIRAAAAGSPGLRGAAFAVLDRIGGAATPEIRAALTDPLLRAHAAVWLHEHDEEAELRPEDRTWLLVDLGAGLLEEADPLDVVAELLPEVPAPAQADIVAGLWRVDHPGVIGLLTALSEHHPDPGVARAARKAAFKARSPGGSARQDS
jgi:hypothetical protein